MIQGMSKMVPIGLLLLTALPNHERADQNKKITTASISDLQHASGFAKVCGRGDTAISEENLATLKTSDGDPKLLYEAMDAALADRRTCIAYLNGIIDGWQSGHEHGVDVMVFPKGIPVADHYAEALKALSLEQLRAAQAGMNADPICIPEHVTMGETLGVVVRYIQDQIRKNQFMGMAPTARLVHPALNVTYRCPLKSDSQ